MKRVIRWILIVVCLVIFLFAGYKLISTHLEYQKADNFYDQTANQFVSAAPPIVTEQKHVSSVPKPETQDPSANESQTKEPTVSEEPVITDICPIFVDFPSLLGVNDEVVGWLYCEDTVINYPIMRADDNISYLHRMLDGTYNYSGSPFMDYRCSSDFSSGNSVIYGHNMNNGTMFHTLVDYTDQAFYDEHPVMCLLTPDGNYALYLFAGFVTASDSWVYTFHFEDDVEKEEYLQGCIENSTFTAGFTPTVEDTLVTLSTCTYDYSNARYVVMGVLRPAY